MPVVDFDSCNDVLPDERRIAERPSEPLVAHLLEVGEEDDVVDVLERVEIAPADLDLLLVLHHSCQSHHLALEREVVAARQCVELLGVAAPVPDGARDRARCERVADRRHPELAGERVVR
jgi:hypothetical protein